MRILHMPLNPDEESAFRLASSTAVHVWTPYEGWKQQVHHSQRGNGMAKIPLRVVQGDGLARWVRDHAHKLKREQGVIVLVSRALPGGETEYGLWHDTRILKYKDFSPVDGLPLRIVARRVRGSKSIEATY